MKKGETFNESITEKDQVTGRTIRRLTTSGLYNETPTYHLNTSFTADSRYLVFATAREGKSALLKADVNTVSIQLFPGLKVSYQNRASATNL